MVRSKEELEAALGEQLQALRASCESFDRGQDWEAKRIAAALHILLFDPMQRGKKPPRTQSLLTLLGRKASLRFPSFSAVNPEGNLVDWHPLVSLALSPDGDSYKPTVKAEPTRDGLKFSEWWDETVLQLSPGLFGGSLTRKNLVMTMRDQDGGGHIDKAIEDATYRTFAKGQAPGWYSTTTTTGERVPVAGLVHLATVRSIAREFSIAIARARA